MKKLLTIGLLLAAGAIYAASSPSVDGKIDLSHRDNTLTVYCWCGTANGSWDSFVIYFDDETGDMWGTWYKGTASGPITGSGRPDPAGLTPNWYIGEGTFSGDDYGIWKGTFILSDRCWGTEVSPDDPFIGTFSGRACE